MKKVMFVCGGNTCRSVMAEYIFTDLLKKAGRKDVSVYSRGTSVEDSCIGPAVYAAIREYNRQHHSDVDVSSHKPQQITYSDILDADLILAMQKKHVSKIEKVIDDAKPAAALGEKLKSKCHTLRGYAGDEGDIGDPYEWTVNPVYRAYEFGLRKALGKDHKYFDSGVHKAAKIFKILPYIGPLRVYSDKVYSRSMRKITHCLEKIINTV